jgi:hypothetical protein
VGFAKNLGYVIVLMFGAVIFISVINSLMFNTDESARYDTTPTPTVQASTSYYMQDDNYLAPKHTMTYSNFSDWFTDMPTTPEKLLINVSLTARLGTGIEITDKTDLGCLDVVNKARGIKMPSGRYLYTLTCDLPLDAESAVVKITNYDNYEEISYMITIYAKEAPTT